MKEFWKVIIENPLLLVGIINLLVTVFCGAYVIVKKAVRKIKSGEELMPTLEQTYLELRELARNAIYEKEKLFKNASLNGTKTGVFKLDSVLSTIESACLRVNVAFDKEYWTNYVNTEVANMKGVK